MRHTKVKVKEVANLSTTRFLIEGCIENGCGAFCFGKFNGAKCCLRMELGRWCGLGLIQGGIGIEEPMQLMNSICKRRVTDFRYDHLSGAQFFYEGGQLVLKQGESVEAFVVTQSNCFLTKHCITLWIHSLLCICYSFIVCATRSLCTKWIHGHVKNWMCKIN